MKVLVVLTQPPHPESGAAGKTAVGLLRGLLAHGVDVRALAARQHFAIRGDVPADLPVEVVDVEPPAAWQARLGKIRRPRGELASGAFAARVRELAREVDVVHLEETDTAWCGDGLDTPSLVHLHYLARLDRPYGPPWRTQFRDVLEFTRGERAAIRRHRYLAASSPVVAGHLRRANPDADVVVTPLSVDPADYPPAPLDGPPVAGIIGTASWTPTASSLRVLVERVWPLVRARVPEARLLVAGRGTRELGLAGPGVDVAGEVESSRDFFAGLSVLLYPLARGSGMKVKVLESLASGVPVVTTTPGAEGVDGGAGVTVEDSSGALAAAAAELLLDGGLRRERGAAARKAFEERYAPEPATRPLVELYERMARAAR